MMLARGVVSPYLCCKQRLSSPLSTRRHHRFMFSILHSQSKGKSKSNSNCNNSNYSMAIAAQAKTVAPPLTNVDDLINSVETFIFDCDGVVWKGDKLIDGVPDTLDMLRDLGKRLVFVKNNSTKSRKQYGKKFESLGLSVGEEEIFASSFAAAAYLKSIDFPSEKKVYVIGEIGILKELELAGINYLGGPVLEREDFVNRFHAVTAELEHALNDVPYVLLDVSDEVREQVDLVHAQLRRAKGRVDTQDVDLYEDVDFVLSHDSDKAVSSGALERLAEKLHLKTLPEIKQETRALNRIIAGNGGPKSGRLGEMSSLLNSLRELAIKDGASLDVLENENILSEDVSSPIIPDDFRCPISLELMREPVIVATGQTYERACIQKWLDAGNKTCPKTQQPLTHLILTPNYVLKSLIAQWCETHGIELPKKIPQGERETIEVLLQKLSLGEPDVQRAAALELRMLAKRNTENRVCIAEAGAIPDLVELLSCQDPRTQEHAVTTLLNLSIYEGNKGTIIACGAVHPIVEVLKTGSMEARENAAATLFSLSVVDENKVTIGASGAIPALVKLLCDGTLRGKKDAAAALFNLSIYQSNKARAVRAHVIPPLMQLLRDPLSDMVDEALAILAILATHQEGRAAISQASAIPILVELIKSGSPRNKENAAAVLFALCSNDPIQLALVRELGAYGPLSELVRTGTARAHRKAFSLLDNMNKLEKNT